VENIAAGKAAACALLRGDHCLSSNLSVQGSDCIIADRCSWPEQKKDMLVNNMVMQ
jgi:hypothetical protein